MINTPIADDNAINFETQFNYFRQSDNRVLAVLTVQTDNDELAFTNSGGLEIARLEYFRKVDVCCQSPLRENSKTQSPPLPPPKN